MTLTKSRLLILAAVAVIVTVAFFAGSNYQKKESDLLIKELNKQHEQRINEIESQLSGAHQLRDSLVRSISDLSIAAKSIDSLEVANKKLQKKVAGGFNHLTDKETEDLMIKMYNDRERL